MVTKNLEDGKQAALVLHEESTPVFLVIGLNLSAESLNVQTLNTCHYFITPIS